MMKKFLSAVIVATFLFSMLVMPAYAVHYNTGKFSSANYTQYEKGIYSTGGDFSFEEDYTGDYKTYIKATANNTPKEEEGIKSDRNPVAYKNSDSDSSDAAKFAHLRVYLAAYEYDGKTAMNKIQIRMDKDGTGSSRNTFILKGDEELAYPEQNNNNTLLDRRTQEGLWTLAKSNDFAEEDFHKIDIISDLGAWKVGTTYLFIDGKFVGMYYDSGLTSNHFHGVVFRVLKGSTIKQNGTSIALKSDPERLGHREYYNTDDYVVTFEDVMQDAGLGAEIDDERIIFKTADPSNYFPSSEDCAVYYDDNAGTRTDVNTNVTRTGSVYTINCTNDGSESYSVAARFLAGLVPKKKSNGTGMGYASYHPRFRYVKVSFDQTISKSGMWLEYATAYSGQNKAIEMWDNGGFLVASVKGSGVSETLNGIDGKALATTTGKNHIDWILEPNDTEDENGKMYQYLYVNGKFVASGYYGNMNIVRLNDIVLSTKNAAGTVTIDNWEVTLYNNTMTLDDFADEMADLYEKEYAKDFDRLYAESRGYKVYFEDLKAVDGEGANSGKFVVTGIAKDTTSDAPATGTKIYTVLFDGNNNLLDFKVNNYVSGETFGNNFETDAFNAAYTVGMPEKARVIVWHPSKRAPYTLVKEVSVSSK